ncbi:hypothetical protein [Oceanobacillus oncorhynchi]|uniref:hypothetical protein n=1 Tax=Oceanobacillus oncorhynchi TaxID=545501 RepID=UPI0025A47D4C|nr:hypothetical protein [Oceanobacillus oncorhynchi]MDM8098699.1 hypothetical protein [Oceanobacillus oncorhynchi]
MEKIPGLDLNVDIVMKGAKKMEKVKLTQEQVVALQRFSNDSAVIKRAVHGFDSPHHKCLEKLTLDELCRVLYTPNSYEVIPQYKVGDWVNYDNGMVSNPRYITNLISEVDDHYVYFDEIKCMPIKQIRHATPEEIQEEKKRRFWDKLGRDVDEYRVDDFIVDTEGDYGFIASKVDSEEYATIDYIDSDFQLDKTYVKSLRLVVPVEQRLDK